MMDIVNELREALNRCRHIESDPNGNWDIRLCRIRNVTVYMVVAKDDKKEYVVEAFVKAKQEGFINELTVAYLMQCDKWAGAIGAFDETVFVAIHDYTRKECVNKFMEIANEVIKKLSEIEE